MALASPSAKVVFPTPSTAMRKIRPGSKQPMNVAIPSRTWFIGQFDARWSGSSRLSVFMVARSLTRWEEASDRQVKPLKKR
jgi:hypothetical protein